MIPGAVRIIHAVLCGFISHREHREHRDLRKNLCVHAMRAGSPRTQVPS